MSMDERILLEIHSLGLYPSRVPDSIHPVDEDISNDISRLQEKHNHQVSRKKTLLNKLLKSTDEARELQEKGFERLSLEKLTGMAYQKYMSCWGPSAPGATGKSCFAEPMFREMFHSGLSHLNIEGKSGKVYGTHLEKVSGTQITPSINHDVYPSDSLFAVNPSSEQPIGGQGEDFWLNIDDDVLQDEDFMGLPIPMDDLSDLNMMV
nr:hypothetical protein [Tanacetum cinerariifolium]